MEKLLQKVKKAASKVATLNGEIKNKVLLEMADELEKRAQDIINENKKDLDYAKEAKLSSAMIDRLLLNETRISSMAQALREIASLKDPVGRVLDGWVTENGLRIEKVSIPIGVIGIIYESRPNVTSDAAALSFKSGNACILKGGKEAINSNTIIANIMQDVLERNNLDREIISLLPDASTEIYNFSSYLPKSIYSPATLRPLPVPPVCLGLCALVCVDNHSVIP